jgi:hypothetical protein
VGAPGNGSRWNAKAVSMMTTGKSQYGASVKSSRLAYSLIVCLSDRRSRRASGVAISKTAGKKRRGNLLVVAAQTLVPHRRMWLVRWDTIGWRWLGHQQAIWVSTNNYSVRKLTSFRERETLSQPEYQSAGANLRVGCYSRCRGLGNCRGNAAVDFSANERTGRCPPNSPYTRGVSHQTRMCIS